MLVNDINKIQSSQLMCRVLSKLPSLSSRIPELKPPYSPQKSYCFFSFHFLMGTLTFFFFFLIQLKSILAPINLTLLHRRYSEKPGCRTRICWQKSRYAKVVETYRVKTCCCRRFFKKLASESEYFCK